MKLPDGIGFCYHLCHVSFVDKPFVVIMQIHSKGANMQVVEKLLLDSQANSSGNVP